MIASIPKYCLLAALIGTDYAGAFTPSRMSVTQRFSSPLAATEVTETEEKVEAVAEVSTPAAPSLASDFKVDEEAIGGLKTLATALNPDVGFYDPLNLSKKGFWSLSNTETIGWLRHAEIKHGRVAMAAFVGYCVQSNFHWPWNMSLDGSPFPSIDLSPEQQWDAIPTNAKLQIVLVVGFLEWWDELGGFIAESPALGMEEVVTLPHYTKGRKPGQYPSFQGFRDSVHWIPDLYDPFNSIEKDSKWTEERKAFGRLVEINNGRLAMLGIFGFLVADKLPNSVPLLKNIAIPYDGNPMIPFSGSFSFFSEAIASTAMSELISSPVEAISAAVTETAAAAAPVVDIATELLN